MFTLNRPDVFAHDDLIIKNSVIKYYHLTSKGKQLSMDILKVAENWRPFRSYACYYLWAYKDNLSK
jgi:DNA-3-methyladenine glycosylase II